MAHGFRIIINSVCWLCSSLRGFCKWMEDRKEKRESDAGLLNLKDSEGNRAAVTKDHVAWGHSGKPGGDMKQYLLWFMIS